MESGHVEADEASGRFLVRSGMSAARLFPSGRGTLAARNPSSGQNPLEESFSANDGGQRSRPQFVLGRILNFFGEARRRTHRPRWLHKLSVRKKRGAEGASEASATFPLPCRPSAIKDTGVGDGVEVTPMDDHRRGVNPYLVSQTTSPNHPRIAEHGSWDNRLGVGVDAVRNGGGDALGGRSLDLPKFVTGDGVVGGDRVATGHDELLSSVQLVITGDA